MKLVVTGHSCKGYYFLVYHAPVEAVGKVAVDSGATVSCPSTLLYYCYSFPGTVNLHPRVQVDTPHSVVHLLALGVT